jgi:hypothetical protein
MPENVPKNTHTGPPFPPPTTGRGCARGEGG